MVLDSKDEGIMTQRNVGKYLSNDTTSCLGTSGSLALMSGIATVSSEQVGVLLVPTAALSHFQFTSRPNGRLLHFVQSFLATV